MTLWNSINLQTFYNTSTNFWLPWLFTRVAPFTKKRANPIIYQLWNWFNKFKTLRSHLLSMYIVLCIFKRNGQLKTYNSVRQWVCFHQFIGKLEKERNWMIHFKCHRSSIQLQKLCMMIKIINILTIRRG